MDAVILKHNIDSSVHHPSGEARMKMSASSELMRMSPTDLQDESQADARGDYKDTLTEVFRKAVGQ